MENSIASRLLLLSMVITCSITCFAQEKSALNLIIAIDDKIATASISNIQLILVNNKNDSTTIEAGYYPGNLFVKDIDSSQFKGDELVRIKLSFTYNEYIKDQIQKKRYSIFLPPSFRNEHYVILRVYNLNKKRYRKRFYPCEQCNDYSYEIESGNQTFSQAPPPLLSVATSI